MNVELIRCAQCNFENLEKMVPEIKFHPLYIISKGQLDEGLGGRTLEQSVTLARSEGYLASGMPEKKREIEEAKKAVEQ